MITKIWMSMQNCGDGSAYPKFMESEALCELDQRSMDEGWGEDCIDSITIRHEGSIIIEDKIYTVADVIEEVKEDMKYDNRQCQKDKLVALEKLTKL